MRKNSPTLVVDRFDSCRANKLPDVPGPGDARKVLRGRLGVHSIVLYQAVIRQFIVALSEEAPLR